MFLKCIACLLGLWLAVVTYAADLLVLIEPSQALPRMNATVGGPSSIFTQDEWVIWPPVSGPGVNNGLLSLFTGRDWVGDTRDDYFVPRSIDTWEAVGANLLASRGYFAARERFLMDRPTFVVRGPRETTTTNALLLGLSGNKPRAVVKTVPFRGPLPEDGLLVYSASGNGDWTDIRTLANRVTGRTLVLEYPPELGELGRYWLYSGFPKLTPFESKIGVPGLLLATSMTNLLVQPDRFRWVKPDSISDPPDAWYLHSRSTGSWVLVIWASVTAAIIAWGTILVMTEHRSRLVGTLLTMCLAVPTALILCSYLTRLAGLSSWPIWLTVSMVAVTGASSIFAQLTKKHPIWIVSLLSLVVLTIANLSWSEFNPYLVPRSSEAWSTLLGSWFSCCVVAMSLSSDRLVLRSLALALTVIGISMQPWWAANGVFLALPVIAWLIAEGRFPWPLYIVLGVVSIGFGVLTYAGIHSAPLGLATSDHAANSFNIAAYADVARSPLLLAVIVLASWGALFGSRFFVYRVRQLIKADIRRLSLFQASLAVFMLSIGQPNLFHAGLVVFAAGMTMLIYDGLQIA